MDKGQYKLFDFDSYFRKARDGGRVIDLSDAIKQINDKLAEDAFQRRQQELKDWSEIKDQLVATGIPECKCEKSEIIEQTFDVTTWQCPTCGRIEEDIWTEYDRYGRRRN